LKSIPFETYNPKYLDIYVYPTERNNPINGIDPHTTQNLHGQGTSGLVGLFNLAELYEVENRALKQAVRRNADRFPDDFMFQLNKGEWHELITICDQPPRRSEVQSSHALRIYLTRRFNTFKCPSQPESHTGQHCNYEGICNDAAVCPFPCRTDKPTSRTGTTLRQVVQ
jgi:hypothetical protein